MTSQTLLVAFWAALYASGSVWFFLHCVRPALLWHRARWSAHVILALMSLLPAVVSIVAPRNGTLIVLSGLAMAGLAAGWLVPQHATRLTGGPAPAKGGLDTVLGWISPAARHLDVGDLQAARAQVEEARDHSTPETQRYVDLWEALVDEEQRRRDGERISRYERLEAIQHEYAQVVLGSKRIPLVIEAALVVGVGAIAFSSVLARLVG